MRDSLDSRLGRRRQSAASSSCASAPARRPACRATTWPSRNVTMRVPYSAMSISCVISSTVMPRSLVQALKDAHHFDAGPRVEVPGRLVRQQNRRVVDQRARDRDALLLTAGELIRMMVRPVAESDQPSSISIARLCRSAVFSALPP